MNELQLNVNVKVFSSLMNQLVKLGKGWMYIDCTGVAGTTYFAVHDYCMLKATDMSMTTEVKSKSILQLSTTELAKTVYKTMCKYSAATLKLKEINDKGYYTEAALRTVDNVDVTLFKKEEFGKYPSLEEIHKIYESYTREIETPVSYIRMDMHRIPDFILKDKKNCCRVSFGKANMRLQTKIEDIEVDCILMGKLG